MDLCQKYTTLNFLYIKIINLTEIKQCYQKEYIRQIYLIIIYFLISKAERQHNNTMKQAIEAFHEISQSVNKNCKDSFLLQNLQKCLFTLEPEAIDIQVYSRLMLSVYDLSNHYTLMQKQSNDLTPIKTNRLMIHNLSIRLKLVAMRMICILMQLMSRGGSNCQRLNQQIQIQALQIMILSIRLCLDSEVQCLQQVIEHQKFCVQLFSYYCAYESELSQNSSTSRSKPINQQMQLLFYINKFDILRLTISQSSFQIYDFKNNLINFNTTLSRFNITPQNRDKYQQYVTNIVTQIILKLLRQGNTDCFYKLAEYLPPQTRMTIEKLLSGDISEKGQVNMGEVYELYWQISVNGMQSISLESLEQFIAKDTVFEGQEIFQAILLTEQPILLQIWFNLVNQRMSKPPNIIMAYQCFISLLITYINKQKPTNDPITQSTKSVQQKQEYLNSLVRLCKQVMLNLIRQNKQTAVPVGAIAQYIAKFMLSLVTQMYKYSSCKEMFENLYMISTKHSLQQVNKTISALNLYYDLLNRQSNEEVYKKFLKFNGTDRSQTMKLLKTCYEMQKSNTQINQQTLNIIQKKPEFALLFCEPKERAMLILNMDIKYLSEMPNVFEIFLALFEQNSWDDVSLCKIAVHLQNLLLSFQFSKMSLNQEAAAKLKRNLGKNLEKQNPIFCILFLYLSCFVKQFQKIKNESYGLAFNKFSKILKILDFIYLEQQQICVLKIIICKSCQKFKKQIIGNAGKCSSQAGQIMFLKIIYQKIEQWIKNIDNPSLQTNQRNSQQFVKFSLFQIYCLNNRFEQIQEIIDEQQNSIMQHLYVNSQYIPRKYKLILLRKLFKSNLTGVSSIITLNDMKQLILLAETSQEITIYITSTIQMFGEKGKKFINLLALQYSRVAEQCLQIFNSQTFAI